MKGFVKFSSILMLLLFLGLFGCGSDTSGTLTMSEITATDLTGGSYQVESTATYVPSEGKSPEGAVINFTAVYTTISDSVGVTRSSSIKVGSNGIAPYIDTVVQIDKPIYLRLTASFGELSQTKIIPIPAIVVAP
jgi:hypothetical protein